MKKIIFTIDTNSAGGAERVISILANYFVSSGYEAILINSDSDSHFYHIDDKVKVIKLNMTWNGSSVFHKLSHFQRKVFLLYKIFKKEKPEYVLTFLYNMEIPTIIAAKLANIPVFTSLRNSLSFYPYYVKIFRKIFYPHIAGVVFQSNRIMEAKDFRKIKNKIVIMNPISIEYSNLNSYVHYQDRSRNIISVGRLTKQKNQKLLIDSFQIISNRYPDITLHFFGSGELENNLREYVSSLNCNDKIFFEGTVSNAILKNRDALAFVMPSDYEGFPNALIEAMACGIPSICTDFDSGTARELIVDGKNGFLVKVGDKDDLTKKLISLIEMEGDSDLIAAEAVKILDLLNPNEICRQWEQFFKLSVK